MTTRNIYIVTINGKGTIYGGGLAADEAFDIAERSGELVSLKAYKADDSRIKHLVDDWGLVVAALSPMSRTIQVTEAQFEAAYLKGDGFGVIGRGFAREQCFDWSHVRDSSDEAIAEIARVIRAALAASR